MLAIAKEVLSRTQILAALGYDFSADRQVGPRDWLVTPAPIRKAAGVVTQGLALGLVAVAVVLSWFDWLKI